jgi:hypothetical protein
MVSRALSGQAKAGGHIRMMREIMEVPLPRAASRRLISFLTFQISMFFSASFPWGCCDMTACVECVCGCVYGVRRGAKFACGVKAQPWNDGGRLHGGSGGGRGCYAAGGVRGCAGGEGEGGGERGLA